MAFQEKNGDNLRSNFSPAAPPPAPSRSAISSASGRQQQTAAPSPSQQGQQGQIAGALTQSVALDMAQLAMTKTALPLQITILREGGEVPPTTVLNAGETVRLRIHPPMDGILLIEEGGKTVVTAPVQRSKPYDTPSLPFEGAGRRELSIRFSPTFNTVPVQPLTLRITLTYR